MFTKVLTNSKDYSKLTIEMQRIYKLFFNIIFFLHSSAECSSVSDQLKFKLQGSFESKAVLLRPYSLIDSQVINKHINMYTNGYILFKAKSKITEYDVTYGIKIGLHLLDENSGEGASSVYFKSNLGKIEIGSDKSSYDKMKIVSETPRADNVSLNSPEDNLIYYMGFDNFIDSKMRDTCKVEYSRKVTYYTPKFNNIQLGISFIPDSSNMGYTDFHHSEWHNVDQNKYFLKVTNGVTLGISYIYKMNKEVEVEASIVNERGKTNWYKKDTGIDRPSIFHNLNTYTGGIKLNFKQHLFAISHSYLGNSLKIVDSKNKSSEIYGVSYGRKYYLDNRVNFSFLRSNHNGNIFSSSGVTINYQPVEGLEAYLGLTKFKVDGKSKHFDIDKEDRRSGWVTIVGTKIVL